MVRDKEFIVLCATHKNRTKNISIKGHCNLRQEIYGFIGKGTQISHCSGHPPQYIKLLTFEERLI